MAKIYISVYNLFTSKPKYRFNQQIALVMRAKRQCRLCRLGYPTRWSWLTILKIGSMTDLLDWSQCSNNSRKMDQIMKISRHILGVLWSNVFFLVLCARDERWAYTIPSSPPLSNYHQLPPIPPAWPHAKHHIYAQQLKVRWQKSLSSHYHEAEWWIFES